MDKFAKAARCKYRFETNRGPVSVEDLWDLPLTSTTGKPNLDDIAKSLYKQIKDGEEVSFVQPTAVKSAEFAVIKDKFDIVKEIIDVKLAEAEAAKKEKELKEKNQRILELIAKKDDEELAAKSREELVAMLTAN